MDNDDIEEVVEYLKDLVSTIIEKIIESWVVKPLIDIFRLKKITAKVILTLFFIVFGGWIIKVLLDDKDSEQSSQSISVERQNSTKQFLPGNYSVSVTHEDTKKWTASTEIRMYTDSEYRMVVFSEYAPEFIIIRLQSDGTLFSDQLGIGTLTYNKELDKITLLFIRNGYTWKAIR